MGLIQNIFVLIAVVHSGMSDADDDNSTERTGQLSGHVGYRSTISDIQTVLLRKVFCTGILQQESADNGLPSRVPLLTLSQT